MSNPLALQSANATNAQQMRLALRPPQAAKALGISERSLWQLKHDGEIRFVRVGRAIVYPVAELEAWLRKQTESGKGGAA